MRDQRAEDVPALVLGAADLADPVVALDAEPERAVERVLRLVGAHRDHGQLRRRPVQERVVVVLGRRAGRLAERVLVEPLRRAQVGHVEQRELRALRLPLLVRVLAEAEQQVVPDRVQVRREAEDLQLAAHPRLLRVGEVERVERVDLAEGDDVALLAEEAHGEDAFAAPESADPSDFIQLLAEDRHEALALALLRVRAPWRLVGRRHPQEAVVLRQRELVQHEAAHLTRGAVVRRLGVADREPVDRREAAGVHLLVRVAHGRVEPLLGRDEQAALRRVDRLRVGHERVGVDRLQAPVEADRQHGEHPRARVPRRPSHVVALDDPRPSPLVAHPVAQDAVGHPGREARAANRLPLVGLGLLLRLPALVLDRPRRRRRGDHDARHRPAQAGRHVVALDRERVQELRGRRVGHVDLEQARRRLRVRIRVGAPAANLARARLRLGLEHRVVPVRRQREHAVTRHEQLVAVSLQRQRADELRLTAADVEHVQRARGHHVQALAVRLDDVRLVDALLLHVRRRVVDAVAVADRALLRRRRRGRLARPAGLRLIGDREAEPDRQPAGLDDPQRVLARVVPDGLAGGERPSAALRGSLGQRRQRQRQRECQDRR